MTHQDCFIPWHNYGQVQLEHIQYHVCPRHPRDQCHQTQWKWNWKPMYIKINLFIITNSGTSHCTQLR